MMVIKTSWSLHLFCVSRDTIVLDANIVQPCENINPNNSDWVYTHSVPRFDSHSIVQLHFEQVSVVGFIKALASFCWCRIGRLNL